jgi:hypothetical protein
MDNFAPSRFRFWRKGQPPKRRIPKPLIPSQAVGWAVPTKSLTCELRCDANSGGHGPPYATGFAEAQNVDGIDTGYTHADGNPFALI